MTDGKFKGERVRWTGYFTPTEDKKGKTVAERTIESLQICGWTGDDLYGFIRKEMMSVLLDEPRFAADRLAALLAASSALVFLPLPADAGAEISGHGAAASGKEAVLDRRPSDH